MCAAQEEAIKEARQSAQSPQTPRTNSNNKSSRRKKIYQTRKSLHPADIITDDKLQQDQDRLEKEQVFEFQEEDSTCRTTPSSPSDTDDDGEEEVSLDELEVDFETLKEEPILVEPRDVPPEPYVGLPPNSHIFVSFIAGIFAVYYFSLFTKLALFYAITWSVNPFTEWPEVLYMVKVSLKRHKGLPITYNMVGFGYMFYKIFVCYPLETILWHLDDLLFPNYANTEIKEPLFLLGQPRSGTTMFESLLSEDQDRFCSMYLYEMRFPYLSIQLAVDMFQRFDQTIFGGRIYQFILDAGWLHCLPEDGERTKMRRLRYDLPDEDDLVFFYHTMCHFLLAGLFPDAESVRVNHRFADLPQSSKTKYMTFHRKAIQKVMYRRGHGKRYLAKWVAGWNGQLDEAKSFYPDAKYVVIVRNPQESLRSWMKLQGLLASQLSGNNIMRNFPDVRQAIIHENIEWFRKEVEFCNTTPRKQLLVLRYTDIVADIPKRVGSVYHFLGQYIEKGSGFDRILQATKDKQKQHKKTPIRSEDELITPDQIEQFFPNLLEEITFSDDVPPPRHCSTNQS